MTHIYVTSNLLYIFHNDLWTSHVFLILSKSLRAQFRLTIWAQVVREAERAGRSLDTAPPPPSAAASDARDSTECSSGFCDFRLRLEAKLGARKPAGTGTWLTEPIWCLTGFGIKKGSLARLRGFVVVARQPISD